MFKLFKNRGFSDRLYWYNFIIVQFITQECFLLMLLSAWLNMNSTALACIKVLLTVAWTELSAHTGLIIWKAKAENQAKFAKQGINVEVEETFTEDLASKVDSIYLETIEDVLDEDGALG